MLRNVSLLLVCVAGLAIGGLLACDNRPSHSPGLSTPTTPGAAVVRLEIEGPSAVPPGGTVQLTAIARLSDGSSRDITQEAVWASSNRMVLTVSAGRVTGVQTGEARALVGLGATTANREVIVVPQDTFRIVGLVTEVDGPSSPVIGATVAVASGVGAGLTTSTGDDGRYKLYGLAGDVELQISKNGYHTHVQQYRADHHAILNAQLRLVNARRDLSGAYTLTIAAADDCRFQLPEELRVRNYRALVTLTGNQLDVRLEGATFALAASGQGDKFRGRAEAGELLFMMGGYEAYAYFYYKLNYGDIVEQLTDSSFLVVSGRASVNESSLSGVLDGAITLLSGTMKYFPQTIATCRSTAHRFTLRR
jgi:Bacterial Ig-like domain (group 2)